MNTFAESMVANTMLLENGELIINDITNNISNHVQPGSIAWESYELDQLVAALRLHGIQAQRTDGKACPAEALMHDKAAVVPAVVVTPRSEMEISSTLRLLNEMNFHGRPVSVKSGGHGYFNGATCAGVMLNLSSMTERRVEGTTLSLQPGCLLAGTIDVLATHQKAVPHGDCFGVGAGGHFITAGWDLILCRKYGLGCQNVIGGRVVLWDGEIVDVDEETHPELLYAMRGGAVAGAGVVAEVRLRLIDEPPRATWRFTRISRAQLRICIENGAFSKGLELPRDVSVSFRLHFEPDQYEPVCSFNIVSLLPVAETLEHVRRVLGDEVSTLVSDTSQWSEKDFINIRMLPASERVASNPALLRDATAAALKADPMAWWKPTSVRREMASSFFTSISYWVRPECEAMLDALYGRLDAVRDLPARERLYALIILGGGRVTELQAQCAMPLGQALARFELHWDDDEAEGPWCRAFTSGVAEVLETYCDETVSRPYRGDIWLPSQDADPVLDAIRAQYERRRGGPVGGGSAPVVVDVPCVHEVKELGLSSVTVTEMAL